MTLKNIYDRIKIYVIHPHTIFDTSQMVDSILKNNMNNDLLYQLAVIFLTLNSNGSMERQFRSVGVKVDKMREISQMLDGAVQSVRSISEMRGQIKQLMQKDYNKQ